jgi:hypothetical protein
LCPDFGVRTLAQRRFHLHISESGVADRRRGGDDWVIVVDLPPIISLVVRMSTTPPKISSRLIGVNTHHGKPNSRDRISRLVMGDFN